MRINRKGLFLYTENIFHFYGHYIILPNLTSKGWFDTGLIISSLALRRSSAKYAMISVWWRPKGFLVAAPFSVSESSLLSYIVDN